MGNNMATTKKIKVRICVGTACFVQGGADLLLYNDFLDPEVVDRCEIEGCSCLEACRHQAGADGKPPFVSIDGKVYGNVTQDRLVELLTEAVHA